MFLRLLKLHFLDIRRSPIWQTEKTLNIMGMVIIALFALYLLVLGFAAPALFDKLFPGMDPMQLFNGFFIYYLTSDLLMRYYLQETPHVNLQTIQLLPIKRRSLVLFYESSLFFSFFNVFPLFLLGPFALTTVWPAHGLTYVVCWLLTYYLILLSNNIWIFIFRSSLAKNPVKGLLIVVLLVSVVVLEKTGLVPFAQISSDVFKEANWYKTALSFCYFVLVLYTGFQAIKNWIKKANDQKKTEFISIDLFSSMGNWGWLLNHELRLVLRNKRPKQLFLLSFLLLFYGFAVFPKEDRLVFELTLGALFTTSMVALNYLQFFLGWDGVYYDRVLTIPLQLKHFIEGKWRFMFLLNTLCLIVTVPYVYYGLDVLLAIVAFYFLCNGIIIPLMMYWIPVFQKQIDMKRSTTFNYQGVTGAHFLLVLPVIALPIVLVTWLSSYMSDTLVFFILLSFGALGLICKNMWLQLIVNRINKNKYKISKNLRTK